MALIIMLGVLRLKPRAAGIKVIDDESSNLIDMGINDNPPNVWKTTEEYLDRFPS